MASNKQYTIEIRLNEDAELATAVLFFQILIRAMAKFGLTYFREAAVTSNFRELMRFETSTHMMEQIKAFHDEKMGERAVDKDVN